MAIVVLFSKVVKNLCTLQNGTRCGPSVPPAPLCSSLLPPSLPAWLPAAVATVAAPAVVCVARVSLFLLFLLFLLFVLFVLLSRYLGHGWLFPEQE